MTNQEEIRRQIQNRFGSPIVHREASPIGFAKPEPTLGDILREAIAKRESTLPSPVRDFATEEAREKLYNDLKSLRTSVEDTRLPPLEVADQKDLQKWIDLRKDTQQPVVETCLKPAPKEALTGGKVNYYLVKVDQPQREEQAPYQAECEDIIRALGMNFDEGCLFKALWRSVNARKGNGKPGLLPEYDAEKMVHYATRILNHARNTNNG